METRIKFLPRQQRLFLLQVAEKSSFSTEKLAKLAGVVGRSYRDWRREKLTMSLRAAEVFCNRFDIVLPEKKELLVRRWRNAKKKAARIGGLNCYKKHGSPGTLEGRRKGGRKALYILRKRGIIPWKKSYALPSGFSEELAEYMGILLGDGGLTQWQVCITLNSEADKNYIPFVVSLGKQLFGIEPKLIKRKHSKAIVIYYNGVKLVNYLTKIGLKTGNKIKQQVDVPSWIKSSITYRTACLRGLMDTDGGVFLHRYKVRGKTYTYKKISFANRSLPLISFVSKTLKIVGLTPKIFDKMDTKRVWLYNKDEIEEYLNLVGTHNPRLLKYQDN